MKNSELIASFVNDNFFSGETYKCNNLNVKDHKLFSYSTCIAEWVSIDSILINFNGYSNTTKRHKNTLQSYLHYEITKNGKNYDIKYVRNVPINAQELKMYYLNN